MAQLKNPVIEVRQKIVYGRKLLEVVDYTQRSALGMLTDKRTLNESDVRALRELGFEVVEVLPEVVMEDIRISSYPGPEGSSYT